MLNKTKEYHAGRARLVPAGQESLNGYQTVAVKFEKNETVSSHIKRNPRAVELRLRDRTIRIASRSSQNNIMFNTDADLLVSTKRDMNQYRELDTDMLLFNPIHASTSLNTQPYKDNGIDVLVDSGGFQLVQGTTDFVDPITTQTFYKKHATIGVGLDFPSPPFVDALLYKENCHLQALNNEMIRAGLPSSVSLAPVVHGATVKTRLHCLKTVYQPGRDLALCVSGLAYRRSDSIERSKTVFACLASVLHRTRKDVLYYHLLGATSNIMIALCAFLAQTKYVISVGGDSVSHRQSAIGGNYQLYAHFKKLPTLSQPKLSHVSANLPCPCPICSAVGDARVLRDFRMSELHHLYQSISTKMAIEKTVYSYINGKITRRELLDFVVGPETSKHATPNMMFDYFEKIVTDGYDKTPRLAPTEGFTRTSSLFESSGTTRITASQQATLDRYAKIHKVYAKYHKVSKLG